jgi:hypothetical protein
VTPTIGQDRRNVDAYDGAVIDRVAAEADIRSLLAPTLRTGSGRATSALAALLTRDERPISLVSGQLEGATSATRSHLLLVTGVGLAIADLKGRNARRWAWVDFESFSTRNSNPASNALDFVTLGLSKSMSCMFVFRLKTGDRLTFSNVRPERRGFTVGRRIAWYTRRGKFGAAVEAQGETAAQAVKLAGTLGGALKRKANALAQSVSQDAASTAAEGDVRDETVTPADVLDHLNALYEAGMLSEGELRQKAREAGFPVESAEHGQAGAVQEDRADTLWSPGHKR